MGFGTAVGLFVVAYLLWMKDSTGLAAVCAILGILAAASRLTLFM